MVGFGAQGSGKSFNQHISCRRSGRGWSWSTIDAVVLIDAGVDTAVVISATIGVVFCQRYDDTITGDF